VGVGVLIASVCDEVDVFLTLGYVWSKNFPVVTTVFKSDLALQGLNEMLANLGRASEEGHLGISLLENLFHNRAIGVDKVHVFLGETAVVHHANPLFKDVTTSHVRLNKRLVSHHESSHKLEDRDLNGEVEGSDNTDRSEGESVTLRHLTFMISRVRETSSKETNLVTAEVFKESTSNSDFGFSLLNTPRDSSLGASNQPVEDLLVQEFRPFFVP